MGRRRPGWRDDLLLNPLVVKDGWCEFPTDPGLGTDLNMEVCLAHPYRESDNPRLFHDRAVVVDW